MAITRKPRNEDTIEDFSAPTAEIFEDVDNENAPDPKSVETDRIAELTKMMQEMQQQLQETQRANFALMSNNGQQSSQGQQSFTPENPDAVKLPDPALDPDGYALALNKRTDIKLENERRQREFAERQRQEMKEKVDDLWSDFSIQYPDYAEHQDRIDYIASKLAAESAKRGVDVQRYMFVTRDKFLADVATKYEEVFGPAEENEEDYPARSRSSARSGTQRSPRGRNRAREEGMVSRTSGIFGGQDSGGRPTGGRDEEDHLGSMIDDIQVMQRKTGFF